MCVGLNENDLSLLSKKKGFKSLKHVIPNSILGFMSMEKKRLLERFFT